MSIKFICKCGKHLRARESLAGKRSVCPACGELVGVPSLQPTHRGTEPAPLSPVDKAKLGRPVTSSVPPAEPAMPPAPRPKRSWRRARRLLSLEKHWYECLRHPVYTLPVVVPLSFGMTALSGIAALAFSELSAVEIRSALLLATAWVAPFLIVGYLCGFLQSVLGTAAEGEMDDWPGPGVDLLKMIRALAAWIVCFLAGPIVFFAAAAWFWYRAGDPAVADWLIVIELVLAGSVHWLLTLAAVQQSGRLRDANPIRVGDLIRRLGYGAVLATLGAAAVGLLFGLLLVKALQFMHEEFIAGWMLLFAAWLGGLAWLTFFFRLLGLWCFRSRVEEWHAETRPISSRPATTAASANRGERGQHEGGVT
ncbi:MAG: hypothetical protein L0Y71_17160 [Gemmataceae bacterium]|nr:hypothetical protein [Gemmataceae bacterium]